MRYMIQVRATPESEAELTPAPDPELMRTMIEYHRQLAEAGVLLDAAGLRPSRDGFRVDHAPGAAPRVIDGPFAETKELIAGYTLIQVRSHDEALEWARRFPAPFGPDKPGVVEVRRLYEMDDFPPLEGVESMRELPGGGAG